MTLQPSSTVPVFNAAAVLEERLIKMVAIERIRYAHFREGAGIRQLGRFLQDRDTRAVHDVYAAKPECLVDAIRNGTFFHFWSEVVTDTSVADDLPCPHCMAP